jgi:hypothetical protein
MKYVLKCVVYGVLLVVSYRLGRLIGEEMNE